MILIPFLLRLPRRRHGHDLLPLPSRLAPLVVMNLWHCLWSCSWVYLERGPSLMETLLVWWFGLRVDSVLALDWRLCVRGIHHMLGASMSLFLPSSYIDRIGLSLRSRHSIAYIRCACIFQGVESWYILRQVHGWSHLVPHSHRELVVVRYPWGAQKHLV